MLLLITKIFKGITRHSTQTNNLNLDYLNKLIREIKSQINFSQFLRLYDLR